MADENNTPTPAPDYAGYPSPDELVRGYRNSSAEAKRLAAENQRLQEQLQAAANPRQDIPQRQSAWDRLREMGVPPDDFREAAREVFAEALKPLAEVANARPTLIAQYPDYVKYENDVMGWIREDPARSQWYDNKFMSDPVGTAELAFLKFGEAKRRSVVPPQNSNQQDMVDASLPTNRVGDSRKSDSSDQNEIDEAFKRFQSSGSQRDAEAFAKLRLRQAIPDSFFNGT